jgi:hypothetical protein
MIASLTMKELETAIQSLKQRKSPSPDGVTNDILRRLGTVAKKIAPQNNKQQLKTRNRPAGLEGSNNGPYPKTWQGQA